MGKGFLELGISSAPDGRAKQIFDSHSRWEGMGIISLFFIFSPFFVSFDSILMSNL